MTCNPDQPLGSNRPGRWGTYMAVLVLLEDIVCPSAITNSTVQYAGRIDFRELNLCSWCNHDAILAHPTHDRVKLLHPLVFFLVTLEARRTFVELPRTI